MYKEKIILYFCVDKRDNDDVTGAFPHSEKGKKTDE